MKLAIAAAAVLLASCAATPVAAPAPPAASPAMTYVTQDTCHPDIPLLDPREPGVVAPKVISKVEPVFPQEIRASSEPVSALILVEIVIDKEGNVMDVCPLRGDPRLVQATIDAIRQWKFSPGTINGQPAAFRVNLTTHYRKV